MNQPQAGSDCSTITSITDSRAPEKRVPTDPRKRKCTSSSAAEDKRRRKETEQVPQQQEEVDWSNSGDCHPPEEGLMKSSTPPQPCVLSKGEAEALFSKEKKTYSNCVERARKIVQTRCGPPAEQNGSEQGLGDLGHPTKLPISKSTFSFREELSKRDCTSCARKPITRGQSTQVHLPLPGEQDEVEVLSLLTEKLPQYKLRVDSITQFTGKPSEYRTIVFFTFLQEIHETDNFARTLGT